MALKLKPGTCPKCVLDNGWNLDDPDDPRRCDHGHLERAVAAAEAKDRAAAAETETDQPWWAT